MSRGPRKKHVQLTLEQARKPDGRHGGWRPGAGRPRKPGAVSHGKRPKFSARFPLHVTLRTVAGAPSLAREWLMKIIRPAIRAAHKRDFRIVEFNVLSNHLHLIVEARNTDALARGVQGLSVRLARRLNRALKRRGKLFAVRYHARALKTPAETWNALRYVLLNRRHHAPATRFDRNWVDPCSSGPWFTGWAGPLRGTARDLAETEPPTATPTVWLLTTGWRRHGLLRFDDAPP